MAFEANSLKNSRIEDGCNKVRGAQGIPSITSYRRGRANNNGFSLGLNLAQPPFSFYGVVDL
jgi:hypothetical protein